MPYPHRLHTPDRKFPDTITSASRKSQVIEIILLYNELTHDIERDIIALEKSRKIEILDGKDDYTMRREIDTAIDEAVARMQAYLILPSAFVRRISTDHAGQWDEKNVYLGLPHNWPPHVIDPLRDAVHNYVVSSVVLYFASLYLSNDPFVTICSERKYRAYNDINAHINTRLGVTHIHPTFLG